VYELKAKEALQRSNNYLHQKCMRTKIRNLNCQGRQAEGRE
jgi:hypothetical protein